MNNENATPAAEARLVAIAVANKGQYSVQREATAAAAYHFGLFAGGRMSAEETTELYTAAGSAGTYRQVYRKVWEFLADQYLSAPPAGAGSDRP